MSLNKLKKAVRIQLFNNGNAVKISLPILTPKYETKTLSRAPLIINCFVNVLI